MNKDSVSAVNYKRNEDNMQGLDEKTLKVIGFYCTPKPQTMGGFLDSITSTISKAAKAVGDAVDKGSKVVKKVADTGTDIVSKAAGAGGKIMSAAPGMQLAKSAISQVPQLATGILSQAPGIITSATPLIKEALPLAPMAFGLPPLDPSVISGLLSAFTGQRPTPGMMQQPPPMGPMQQAPIPGYYNPMQAMQYGMMQQPMRSPMQYGMMQQPYYGMRGASLTTSRVPMSLIEAVRSGKIQAPKEIQEKLSAGSRVNKGVDTGFVDMPFFQALKDALNNPQTILALIRFSAVHGEDEAGDRYINVQRAVSKLRDGVAPEQVLSLLGQSHSLLGESRRDLFDRLIKNLNQEGHYSKLTKALDREYEAGAAGRGRVYDTRGEVKRLLARITNIASWDKMVSLSKEKDIYGLKYDINPSAKLNALDDALDKEYRKGKESQAVSSEGVSSGGGLQVGARLPLIQQGIAQLPLAKLSVTGEEYEDPEWFKKTPGEDGVGSEIKDAMGLVRSVVDATGELKSIFTEAPVDTSKPTHALSRMVATSAINQVKRNSMDKVGKLANNMSKVKLKTIHDQARSITDENAQLKKDIAKLQSQYAMTLNKYRDAQLENKEEIIRMLQRDKDKLQGKLVKAYGVLDTMRNKLEMFRSALQETMKKMSDVSSMDYRRLAQLDKDFAEKLALIDSLGIKVASPETIDKVWSMFTSNLSTSPEYLASLKQEKKNLDDIGERSYDLNFPKTGSVKGGFLGKVTNTLLKHRKNEWLKPRGKSFFGQDVTKAKTINDIYRSNLFPYVNAIAKLVVAREMLDLSRDIIVDDPMRGSMVNYLSAFAKEFNDIASSMNHIIEDYMSNRPLTRTNEAMTMSTKLDDYINRMRIFLRSLAWIGSDLYYYGGSNA